MPRNKVGFEEVCVMRCDESEDAIQFIHAAVGCDARMIFRDAAAVAEAGFAVVAGFGVDAGKIDHALTLAHLPQNGPDALFRQTSLTLPLMLQTLDALQRRQKP